MNSPSAHTEIRHGRDGPTRGVLLHHRLKRTGRRGRRAQLDFVPADPAAFKQAAKQAKWKVVGPKRCFVAQGDDRVGVVAERLDRVGTARINVTAIDAVCAPDGRYAAIFWVAPKDVKKPAVLLGAS